VGGDAVGQLAGLGDGRDGGQGFRRHLLVELHIAFELLDHGAAQGLGLVAGAFVLGDHRDVGLVVAVAVGEAQHGGAALALDQHLHRAVGQLQQLQDGGDHADVVDVFRGRIVVGGILLGDEQDLLVALHHLFKRAHGFVAAHEERHDHVRKHHDVPQRQHRQACGYPTFNSLLAAETGRPSRGPRSRQTMRLSRTARPPGIGRKSLYNVDRSTRCSSEAATVRHGRENNGAS
jgi:hypothetical protein